MTLADKWNEDEFVLNDGAHAPDTGEGTVAETDENIDKLDDFNPADMVYDEGGIQIYKNDGATIMLKVIGTNPLKFVALFVESTTLTDEQALTELDKVIE